MSIIVLKSSANTSWPWAGSATTLKAEEQFRRAFPSLHKHMKQHETALRQRTDQGQFWWELRSCAYYESFEGTKILYPDIAWRPSFCIDRHGHYTNNSAYFLPSGNLWLLAVLNAPLAWWFSWRAAQHAKDDALRFFTSFVEAFPIVPAETLVTKAAAELVTTLISSAQETGRALRALLDWLRVEYEIDKPGQALESPFGLSSDEFIEAVRKRRGKKKLSSAALKSLRQEYTATVEPSRERLTEGIELECQLSDLVNQAYGLTEEEVDLMWRTAPPRMPIPPPE